MVSKVTDMPELKVFTFSPCWGLPTTGPFALKLLKWLDLAQMPYQQIFEDLPARGPKGKNPWIELDGERIGDTEVIIDRLAQISGFDIEASLTAEQRATSHAVRRMIEEHFHMVYEWELFVHPQGKSGVSQMAATVVPPFALGIATTFMRRQFRRQLYQRGLARHAPDLVAQKAIADIDAVSTLIADKPYFLGSAPSMADVSIYGLMYPMLKWPMHTPAADYIKSCPSLASYLERMHGATNAIRMAA